MTSSKHFNNTSFTAGLLIEQHANYNRLRKKKKIQLHSNFELLIKLCGIKKIHEALKLTVFYFYILEGITNPFKSLLSPLFVSAHLNLMSE